MTDYYPIIRENSRATFYMTSPHSGVLYLYSRFTGGGAMVWDVAFTCDICGKKKGEANHWPAFSTLYVAAVEHGREPEPGYVSPLRAELRHDSDGALYDAWFH